MIGGSAQNARRYWLQATAISLALHGVALAGVLYQPDLRLLTRFEPPPEPQISIETLFPEAQPSATPEGSQEESPPPELAAPDTTPPEEVLTASPPEPEVLTPLPPQNGTRVQETGGPQPQRDTDSAIVSLEAGVPSVALPDLARELAAAPPSGGPDTPVPPDAATGQDPAADPMDPRLADLVARLRAQVQSACLLALPQMEEGALRLRVLTSNDREIAPFAAEIGRGMSDPPDAQPVLLDNRQCAGVTFLRRRDDYPAFALPIRLEAPDIASGDSAVGQIENGAGYYNTLLLIDDNGVVQDLRRFLTVQGGRVSFDVPMSREGAARDTSQILIAIATPRPLQSVTQNAGRLAESFFPALESELDDNARVGVVSLYIR